MRSGIVVGLAAEARIARRLGWPVAIGGGTTAGAEAAAGALVRQGCAGLISFGLAGGLDPTLKSGALIVPSAVIADGKHYATDPDLSRMLGGATPHLVLGADAIVDSVEEKRRQRGLTGAAAVDLESGAVARIASTYRHSVRCIARDLRSCGTRTASGRVGRARHAWRRKGLARARLDRRPSHSTACPARACSQCRRGKASAHRTRQAASAGSALDAPAIRIASTIRSGGKFTRTVVP